MSELVTDTLHSEYDAIIASVGDGATDDQVIAALVHDADWTVDGAREIVLLAQSYGTSILRNALALAAAMNIEDGSSGL